MKKLLTLWVCLLMISRLSAANLPPGFAEVQVADGLDPTAMAELPDGRILFTEKKGLVRVIENGILLPDPFLSLDLDNYNERGLGGIAIDPGFQQNKFIYLFYTVKNANHNRVSRFTASGNYAVPGSERVLLDLDPMTGTIHNGGAMAFGPDGKLYISVGDGANADAAQPLTSLLGKVLRINPDGTIPEDNPFYTQATGKYRAIWARGFRNSFTFAIQPGSGRILANDVGSSEYEEVNEVHRGGNYGWPALEGNRTNQVVPEGYEDPAYAYDHTVGCSVIAAAFYNPDSIRFPASYTGKYFFGDYCQGYLKTLDLGSGQVELFATGVDRPVALLTARDGSLYYMARGGIGGGSELDNTSSDEGSIWRIFYTGNGAPLVSRQPADVLVSAGEPAAFEVQVTGVAPFQFQWQRGGADIPGATSARYELSQTFLADSGAAFRCLIQNTQGATTSQIAYLRVTADQRPVPVILSPMPGALYSGGDTIRFAGGATDPEAGILGDNDLTWRILFHHDTHTHPALEPVSGISGGVFLVPDFGEMSPNVWYRILLTATDPQGLSKTVYRDVFPRKADFVLQTAPSGLRIGVEGNQQVTPATITGVQGMTRSLTAPRAQLIGDTLYVFSAWSDGNTQPERVFQLTDAGGTFTAVYEKVIPGKGRGLKGEYFDGEENNPVFPGLPALTRVDTVVNFNWGQGSPDENRLGNDQFLVRWTGKVQPPLSGVYTFYTSTDDGVRLWVNGQLLVDAWYPQGETVHAGTISLEEGRRYDLKMEFYEEGGDAVAKLLWSSEQLPRMVIPRSQLFTPSSGGDGPVYISSATPNPMEEVLTAWIKSTQATQISLRLTDAAGRLVHVQELAANVGEQEVLLDVAALTPGVYFLLLYTRDGIADAIKLVRL
ncbi:MAG: PQQ-dependent sugar dehydrogenase [Bacteroidia bacterium]|nr:PQQ-dependent sugar dehydrogenase [Bacteroidia bacterium]